MLHNCNFHKRVGLSCCFCLGSDLRQEVPTILPSSRLFDLTKDRLIIGPFKQHIQSLMCDCASSKIAWSLESKLCAQMFLIPIQTSGLSKLKQAWLWLRTRTSAHAGVAVCGGHFERAHRAQALRSSRQRAPCYDCDSFFWLFVGWNYVPFVQICSSGSLSCKRVPRCLPRFTSTVVLAVLLAASLELSFETDSEAEELESLGAMVTALKKPGTKH